MDLLDDALGHLRYQPCRDVGVIHLFERVHDVTGAQAPGVEGEDLVVHLGQAGLALADKLRLERAVAITRRLDGDLSVLPFEALGGIAIAIVTGPAALWGVCNCSPRWH